MDVLIKSMEKLIEQSTAALGADAPATLSLKQQLAALLEQQEKSRKVFWMQPSGSAPPDPKKE